MSLTLNVATCMCCGTPTRNREGTKPPGCTCHSGTQNAYDRRADKAISNQDVPHHVVLAYSYELPIGKGKKLMGHTNAATQSALVL